MKTYTEQQISEAVEMYATFHGVDVADVSVTRNYADGVVIGYRLSVSQNGTETTGRDETFGEFRS